VGGFPWLKGHGTENDFVLLPGADGSLHGDLDDDLMRFLCDRHAGIGADGVLRIVAGDKQSYVEDGGEPPLPTLLHGISPLFRIEHG
jgi:diaminopimelate epimerase